MEKGDRNSVYQMRPVSRAGRIAENDMDKKPIRGGQGHSAADVEFSAVVCAACLVALGVIWFTAAIVQALT